MLFAYSYIISLNNTLSGKVTVGSHKICDNLQGILSICLHFYLSFSNMFIITIRFLHKDILLFP